MKQCCKCKKSKPACEFSPRPENTSDGLASWCKECRNEYSAGFRVKHKDRLIARRKELYHADPSGQQARARQYLFGISPQQYSKRLEDQDGVCAICKQKDRNGRSLAVDHDHTSGKIRGLLCRFCNTALGLFRDNPITIQDALDYLDIDLASRTV